MLRNSRHIPLVITLFVSLVLLGCVKTDTLPQLEVQVVDESGIVVSGAYVALFPNLEEWRSRINPVQVWQQTDADGKVLFVDLQDMIYFIYVRFDGKDNSVGEISTMEPLQVNQRNQIIISIR